MLNSDFVEVIFILLLFVIFYLLVTLKKVPPKTTIIIDRDSHFYKKKSFGFFFMNPARDKITSIVSTNLVRQYYVNTFSTHDSYYFTLSYTFEYNSEDIDTTLSSLEDSRRSIYDITNCAVEAVINSCSFQDIEHSISEVEKLIFKELELMLEPFYIDVTDFRIISKSNVSSSTGQQIVFKKHVSSGYDPIK